MPKAPAEGVRLSDQNRRELSDALRGHPQRRAGDAEGRHHLTSAAADGRRHRGEAHLEFVDCGRDPLPANPLELAAELIRARDR